MEYFNCWTRLAPTVLSIVVFPCKFLSLHNAFNLIPKKINKWLAKQKKKLVHVLSLKVYHSFSIFFRGNLYISSNETDIKVYYDFYASIMLQIDAFDLQYQYVKSQFELPVHMDTPDFRGNKKLKLKTKTWFLVTLKWKARAKKWLLLVQLLKRDVNEGLNSLKQERIEAKVHELI